MVWVATLMVTRWSLDGQFIYILPHVPIKCSIFDNKQNNAEWRHITGTYQRDGVKHVLIGSTWMTESINQGAI